MVGAGKEARYIGELAALNPAELRARPMLIAQVAAGDHGDGRRHLPRCPNRK
jgi:hypothetical protein